MSKGRKHRPRKVGVSETSTIVREVHGAKIHEKRHHVCMIEYPDGSTRSFVHAPYGGLVKMTEPDGTVWKRSPIENAWLSSKGVEWQGRIEVSRSGVVTFIDAKGDRRVYSLTGAEFHPTSYNELDTLFLKTLYLCDTNADGIISRQESVRILEVRDTTS